MSAIAGIWDRAGQRSGDSLAPLAARMVAQSTAHPLNGTLRNVSQDAPAGIALAYQGQVPDRPAVSSCGRFVLACEGEIYNSGELIGALRAAGRAIADGLGLAVMAEAAAQWGAAAMLRRANGAFAGALWDREQRTLHLFRDRFGIRPLYYAEVGREIFFASRLSGLRASSSFAAELDRDSLAGYLRGRSVAHPDTIYRGAKTLAPGTVVRFGASGGPSADTFWALEESVLAGRKNPFAGSAEEAVDETHRLLREAVRQRLKGGRMGVLLSGGVDSTLLYAILHEMDPRSVVGFTVGYSEARYSEAPYAEAAARHINGEQHTLHVSGQMAMDAIARLPDILDEPNGDISLIPAYLISQMARAQVDVAFTGEGAVEPLRTVIPYFRAARVYARIDRVPRVLRQIANAGIRAVPPAIWSSLGGALPGRFRVAHLDYRLDKIGRVLAGDDRDMYRAYRSYWLDPDDLVIDGHERPGLLNDPRVRTIVPDFVDRINYVMALTTCIDSVTAKADRAAAAAGLWLRMPYLQPAYLDFGWSLPLDMRVRDGRLKWTLRQAMCRYLPADMVFRKRMGFDVPLGLWLRGPMRDWAEDLLDEGRLRREGILNPAPIRQKWVDHLSGRSDWSNLLWLVLVFQAWKQRWLP